MWFSQQKWPLTISPILGGYALTTFERFRVMWELTVPQKKSPVQGGPLLYSYKWSYNPYKYGYNLSYPFLRPVIGVITPFTTSRGPPCRMARWFIVMVHVESNMPVPWMLWDWFTNRWTESHGFLGRWKKGAYKHASVGLAFATWTFDFRKEPFKLLGCLNNSPNLVMSFPGKDWRLPFHFQLRAPLPAHKDKYVNAKKKHG